ncbi:hypothetical protein NDU88_003275 [Pleurodeles waltl]|uniref:Uncharacterized protein n=1 Tax=Pleurodeles waltl TaxID=8319 RepID=A0AAV7WRX7_PLEWA|nr:hypothetical protein NDU88_003275 [Pleurodeles waltl]
MAVTPAAVRTATTGAHRHWLLKPIGFNVNQCGFAPRSSTAYHHGTVRLAMRGDGGIFSCTDRWWTCQQWRNDMPF